MFIVLALSFSNSLDKSQGAAAESILLQITRKSAELQAENAKDGGQGVDSASEHQMLRKYGGPLYRGYFSHTVDAASEMQNACPLGGKALTFQATALTRKIFEVHPLPH